MKNTKKNEKNFENEGVGEWWRGGGEELQEKDWEGKYKETRAIISSGTKGHGRNKATK